MSFPAAARYGGAQGWDDRFLCVAGPGRPDGAVGGSPRALCNAYSWRTQESPALPLSQAASSPSAALFSRSTRSRRSGLQV